eukprot:116813-Prymnesium_polylepis.1
MPQLEGGPVQVGQLAARDRLRADVPRAHRSRGGRARCCPSAPRVRARRERPARRRYLGSLGA